MSEEVKVTTTPIQRNINDVAMELTELYYKENSSNKCTIEKIQETYRKFYATAQLVSSMDYDELIKI